MHPEHQEIQVVESCDQCEKTFKDGWMLRRHRESVHEKFRAFDCDQCDFKGKRKQHLEDHMRIHAGQYYSCSNCDFKTLRNR